MSSCRPRPYSAIGIRALAFALLWLILSGADVAGLPAGLVATVAATWMSLILLPAPGYRVAPIKLCAFVVRFLLQSVVAGKDVAWRALHPKLPLRPGLVGYPVQLPRGMLRNTFCTISALLPGTLPIQSGEGENLFVHCLDLGETVTEQMREEERQLVQILGGGRDDG
jgi:multicomponent Na+:H+ antiporter subunit E